MAIITLPTALKVGPDCDWGLQHYALVGASESGGSEQVRLLSPSRWVATLKPPEWLSVAAGELAEWQALAAQLRGRVNVLAAWNWSQPAPRGTMRGTLTLSASAAAGATSISVTGGAGQAGTTWLAGDMLQVGTGLGTSQLVMVTAPATANGSGVAALSIEPPLRDAYTSGTACTWDKPLAYFRGTAQSARWTYGNSGLSASGIVIPLVETWTA